MLLTKIILQFVAQITCSDRFRCSRSGLSVRKEKGAFKRFQNSKVPGSLSNNIASPQPKRDSNTEVFLLIFPNFQRSRFFTKKLRTTPYPIFWSKIQIAFKSLLTLEKYVFASLTFLFLSFSFFLLIPRKESYMNTREIENIISL